MSFKEWLFSSYPNPSKVLQWGWLHISVLIASIAAIVFLCLFFKNKSGKAKKIVFVSLIGILLTFEIVRRILCFSNGSVFDFNTFLYVIFPRPWCAISVWLLIISLFVNKKFFYNMAAINAFLCTLIYFCYPSAGFNNLYILFEQFYSIASHAIMLVTSVTMIVLGFTDFKYKNIKIDLCVVLGVFVYALFEMLVLKICSDPLNFTSVNDVIKVLKFPYLVYLTIYIVFLFVYFNLFYFIQYQKDKKAVQIETENK